MLSRVRAAQAAAQEASWEATVRLACAGESSYCMRDGLVCRTLQGDEVSIVVPGDDALRRELLEVHHASPLAGLLGLYRMLASLSKRWYWQGM